MLQQIETQRKRFIILGKKLFFCPEMDFDLLSHYPSNEATEKIL
jgi:hypothetical protein